MGRSNRPRPARLASKLKQIRLSMNLSQEKMLQRLDYKQRFAVSEISEIERDKREPPVMMILCYARAAGISMECLVDDALDLPDSIS